MLTVEINRKNGPRCKTTNSLPTCGSPDCATALATEDVFSLLSAVKSQLPTSTDRSWCVLLDQIQFSLPAKPPPPSYKRSSEAYLNIPGCEHASIKPDKLSSSLLLCVAGAWRTIVVSLVRQAKDTVLFQCKVSKSKRKKSLLLGKDGALFSSLRHHGRTAAPRIQQAQELLLERGVNKYIFRKQKIVLYTSSTEWLDVFQLSLSAGSHNYTIRR